jgi:hypothetical protein
VPPPVQFGRKDHHLPRGYLRGFIDPAREHLAKPFWKYDLAAREWSMESPGSAGWAPGFYDYADTESAETLEHPDQTFARFEREFPLVREHLLKRRYKNWVKQHKGFLLSFMQMMRARSPLFIEQQTAQNRELRGATVTSVGPGNTVTVDSLELRPPPERFIRNRTITQMREEINKGADWMWEFNWCLRWTNDVTNPFVTADQPVVVQGAIPGAEAGLRRHDTLIFFPICWKACLVGSRDRFDVGTAEAEPGFPSQVRELFFRPSTGFVISPCKIDLD